MTQQIPISIAVEDALSESVAHKLIRLYGRKYLIGKTYRRGGHGYLKSNTKSFNRAARFNPYLLLTDLDKVECAPVLIRNWLPEQKHNNMLFRVAVQEVESWLLADRERISRFLGVSKTHIPLYPDEVDDPKATLIKAADRARRKQIRKDIVPPPDSVRKQGANYNGRLIEFVERHWEPGHARWTSDSLHRAMKALEEFKPVWPE